MMCIKMTRKGPKMNNFTPKGPVALARSFVTSTLYMMVSLGLLAGCAADRPLRTPDAGEAIRASLQPTMATKPVAAPFYELAERLPPVAQQPPEPKLDLLVKNGPAREVFLAIVTDTHYNMLLHPDVAGNVSMTLRGVTVLEALEAIRDVYGYYFTMEGRRITVYAPTLQTRIFTLNYPHSQRNGSSSLLVASGGLKSSDGGAENSLVNTTSESNLWDEMTTAVRAMVGDGGGRNVSTSPQSGIMVVRAMPDELLQVEKLLTAAQISVERQVMLEVKIVEVELYDGFQSGIDWSQMATGLGIPGAVGLVGGNPTSNVLVGSTQAGLPSFNAGGSSLLESGVELTPGSTGLYGLALAGHGFQAVLGFLQTRGDVQTLSSPRIATLNNQKALLKVGTDEFFVTNVAGGGATTNEDGTTNSSLPSLSLTPFFSGISLDVTPQVDSANNITLHVRPSVTSVTEKLKQVDLGSVGYYRLPLASSSVNEFDTMVRIQDGNIVAIGGLMQVKSNRKASGFPGMSDIPLVSYLFGNRVKVGRKKELVVLIKPTIIRTAQDWEKQTRLARAALDDMEASRVVRINGTVEDVKETSREK